MDDKITIIGALRWLRDKSGALLASFWMFILLAAITGMVAAGFLQVDRMFVESLAEFSPVSTGVLLTLAWAYRFFTMTYGMAAVWNKHRGEKGRSFRFKVLGYTLALLLLMHCMALSFKMMGDQYSVASSIAEIETEKTDGNSGQITALDEIAAQIRADRDANVSKFEAAIENITSDRLDNDSAADAYRLSIVSEQESARQRLAEIDTQKIALLTSSVDAKVEARQAEAKTTSFHPGFFGMARLFTGQWNPDVEPSPMVAFICGVVFWLFFYAIGEALLMGTPPMAFSMLLLARKQAEAREAEGKVRKEFSHEEWEELLAAKEEKERRADGAKKGGRRRRQGNKIELENEYHRTMIDALQAHIEDGGSVDSYAKKRSMSVPHLKMTLQPYLSRAEFEQFFGVHDVVVANSEGEDDENDKLSA